MDAHKNPTSPKVKASGAASAVAVLVLYLLSRIPAVGELPAEVQAAVTVLVVTGVTIAAGYVKADPHRDS